MTPNEIAERMALIIKGIEKVYGPNGGVAAEIKAAVVLAAVLSLAMESNKEKEDVEVLRHE